jgi:transcriptional regulator of acetoin/glycerol metabolism
VERAVLFSERGHVTARSLANGSLQAEAFVAAERTGAERPGADMDMERDRVRAALSACSGNQSQAARRLGIARNTLIARMRKYGFQRPRVR